MSSGTLSTPSFGSAVIQSDRKDGYWIEKFHLHRDDPVPGIVVSGLVSGKIQILDNPIAESKRNNVPCDNNIEKEWKCYKVGEFKQPVAVIPYDITGNGLMDLIICHNYGPHMLNVNENGGTVTWLENPGYEKIKEDQPWEQHFIGRWPSMHRLRAGYFTQRAFLEVVAAPIVHGPHDKATPVPILLFTAPDDVSNAVEWRRDMIDDHSFTCIHEVVPKKLNGPTGLDSLIVSSREGVTILSYNLTDKKWTYDLIGPGEPQSPYQTTFSEEPGSGDYWGTGSADVGKIGNDPLAYIATLDPFHGVAACVYTKEETPLNGRITWKRHVLDVYGTPNQRLKTGDGPGHYITCADFDGDGDDEFVLSLYGPLDRDDDGVALDPPTGPHPFKGIIYYKALDLQRGIFAKWRISDGSSARVAVADFAGTGRLDLASIKYNVEKYYEEPEPDVSLHLNKIPSAAPSKAPVIFSSLWDNEGMVYIVDPSISKNGVLSPETMPLIQVANYDISVEVYPPGVNIDVPENDGIKVIFGSIDINDKDIITKRSPFSVKPFEKATITVPKDSGVAADKTLGVVLLRLRPIDSTSESKKFPSASDVPVQTKFPLPPQFSSKLHLDFKKVDSLWWGNAFKGKDFYNLTGFHFYFVSPNPSSAAPSGHTRLAHIQFWTAGKGVNCGVHNHAQDSFCEVHVALSAGTGNGGMAKLKHGSVIPGASGDYYNSLAPDAAAAAFELLPMAALDEHGGFWESDGNGQPLRATKWPDTVHYPWHKWQAGDEENYVDVWMAIEFNPDIVDCSVMLGQDVGGAGHFNSKGSNQRHGLRVQKKGCCC